MASTSTSDPMPCERCGQPHPKCTAHTRAGKPCGQKRMAGQTVCRMHGGSAPQSQQAAERRQAETAADQSIAKLWPGLADARPVTDPVAELSQLAGALREMTEVVGQRVTGLRSVAGGEHMTQLRAEVVLLDKLLTHSRAALTDLAKLNLGARQVELESRRAQLVLESLEGGFAGLLGFLAGHEVVLPRGAREAYDAAFVAALRARVAAPPAVGELGAGTAS